MITKGNDTKVQNEVIAQTITDETAKRLKLARLFPKQEIKENSDYYTYFRQNINLDEAIKKGLLGEAKDIAPGATLQELNVRKPISETISIDTIGGVLNVSAQMLDSNLISVNDMLQDVGILIGRSIEKRGRPSLWHFPSDWRKQFACCDYGSYRLWASTLFYGSDRSEKGGSFYHHHTRPQADLSGRPDQGCCPRGYFGSGHRGRKGLLHPHYLYPVRDQQSQAAGQRRAGAGKGRLFGKGRRGPPA